MNKIILSGKQSIGNVDSVTGDRTFYGVDPRTGSALPTAFYEGTLTDVDRAARLAAYDFDAYRNTSPEERAAFLETIADEIMGLGDVLIERTGAETALPDGRLRGERGRTVNQLRLFAQVVREGSWLDARIDRADPERQPFPKPDVRCMQVALGPVAVFGASNFPLAFSVAGGDTASALAAGCPVVVKGHPAHPGASELVGRAIRIAVQKCGMPEGTFSLIQGSGIEVGKALVQHAAIKAVGFTGSFRGGKALFDLAANRPEPIPVYAEMSSTNPVFILPEAMKQRGSALAEGLAQSTTLGVGQFCTNPGLVLGLSGEIYEAFLAEAAASLAQKSAETMLHAGIYEAYNHGIEELTEVEGVTLIAEGSHSNAGSVGLPRLLRTSDDVLLSNPRLEEEVFGPSSLLVSCASPERFVEVAEALHGHLTATIHGTSEELETYQELITVLERKVGRLIFNGFPTGVEVCHAMIHGGPFPATTDSRTTSVGTMAIRRFLRPVSYQNFPQTMLPSALKDDNPLQIRRMVDGNWVG